jgi:hypothetical protein
MMDRRTLVAALLALPAVLAGLGVVAVESWRAVRPQAPLFAPPEPPSLAAALEWGELWQAAGMLRAREDPWAPFEVRHPALTGDQLVRASPLLWAVAVGNTDAVRMLVGFDAPVERPADRQVVCLAEAMDHAAVAAVRRRYTALPDAPCAALDGVDRPLVAVAATSE